MYIELSYSVGVAGQTLHLPCFFQLAIFKSTLRNTKEIKSEYTAVLQSLEYSTTVFKFKHNEKFG